MADRLGSTPGHDYDGSHRHGCRRHIEVLGVAEPPEDPTANGVRLARLGCAVMVHALAPGPRFGLYLTATASGGLRFGVRHTARG